MSQLTVELQNFQRLQEVADKYPRVAEKYVGESIQRALVRVMGTAKREAPMGTTGFLKNKWGVNMGRFTGALVANSEYAAAVHNGTRPHWVPIQPLMRWATKKGLNAYAVRASIAVKGTKANPFLKRAIDQEKDNVDADLNLGIKNIIANI